MTSKYKHAIYKEKIKYLASSSHNLNNRIDINNKYSKKNLTDWLFNKYVLKKNMKILEIGCGLGQHVVIYSKIIKSKGLVLATDISEKSLKNLENYKLKNIQLKKIDMDKISYYLTKERLLFDRIVSVYSIYYSKNPLALIKKLLTFLNKKGELYITIPTKPHTLTSLVNKIKKIPKNVSQSLDFGEKILIPYLKKKKIRFNLFHFNNLLKIKKCDDLLKMYRSSTFFMKNIQVEKFLIKKFNSSYNLRKYFILKKNSLLIKIIN